MKKLIISSLSSFYKTSKNNLLIITIVGVRKLEKSNQKHYDLFCDNATPHLRLLTRSSKDNSFFHKNKLKFFSVENTLA